MENSRYIFQILEITSYSAPEVTKFELNWNYDLAKSYFY